MTIEEVKKHFEAQGIKEGDELICALGSTIDAYIPNSWKYSQFEIDKNGGVSSIKGIGFNRYDENLFVWLYYAPTSKFATLVKNDK